ncbi:SDR family NAD(P)-dependent oxidoreductase [Streptomyces daliensis]
MNTLDSFRLDGARALVTGASRGIGQAIALALAEAGADVAIAARSTEALRGTAEQIARTGRDAFPLAGDFSVPEAAAEVVTRAAETLGGLDTVVHCAGVLPTLPDGSPILAPLQDTEQEDWNTVLTVNLNASAALCRQAHRYLVGSTRAAVVLLSSTSGLIGSPTMEAYAASKAAQVSLARSLGVGWARQGIRVNALCAGWTRTDLTAPFEDAVPVSEWLMSHVPMGRWAEPEEVARAALFLTSPASSYLTGTALALDGGVSVPDGGLAGIPKPPPPSSSAAA